MTVPQVVDPFPCRRSDCSGSSLLPSGATFLYARRGLVCFLTHRGRIFSTKARDGAVRRSQEADWGGAAGAGCPWGLPQNRVLQGAREAGLDQGTGDCKAISTEVQQKWPSPRHGSIFTKELHFLGRELSIEAAELSLCWATGLDPGPVLPPAPSP